MDDLDRCGDGSAYSVGVLIAVRRRCAATPLALCPEGGPPPFLGQSGGFARVCSLLMLLPRCAARGGRSEEEL